jgi:prolipoprotein diacylglyceryltransferase
VAAADQPFWPRLFGGFLGGFAALLLIARGTLARIFATLKFKELAQSLQLGRVSVLEFLDTCSPAASAGYAIGRIGCYLSGDGDYGIPTTLPWGMSFPNGVVPTNQRVHPTPLYELFAWMLIAYVLWRLGARFLQQKRSAGLVFCVYLRSRASHVFWLKRFASTHGRFECPMPRPPASPPCCSDSSSTSGR